MSLKTCHDKWAYSKCYNPMSLVSEIQPVPNVFIFVKWTKSYKVQTVHSLRKPCTLLHIARGKDSKRKSRRHFCSLWHWSCDKAVVFDRSKNIERGMARRQLFRCHKSARNRAKWLHFWARKNNRNLHSRGEPRCKDNSFWENLAANKRPRAEELRNMQSEQSICNGKTLFVLALVRFTRCLFSKTWNSLELRILSPHNDSRARRPVASFVWSGLWLKRSFRYSPRCFHDMFQENCYDVLREA